MTNHTPCIDTDGQVEVSDPYTLYGPTAARVKFEGGWATTGTYDMRDALVWAVAMMFVGLALLHFYWALGGSLGSRAAVPEVGQVPAFHPSTTATVAVAIALLGAAATVTAAGGMITTAAPQWMPVTGAVVLATILLARAVGDFRLVGFFKSHREGRFAELDTLLYSPACVALGLAILAILVTQEHRA